VARANECKRCGKFVGNPSMNTEAIIGCCLECYKIMKEKLEPNNDD